LLRILSVMIFSDCCGKIGLIKKERETEREHAVLEWASITLHVYVL